MHSYMYTHINTLDNTFCCQNSPSSACFECTYTCTYISTYNCSCCRTCQQTRQQFLLSFNWHMYVHVNTLDNCFCYLSTCICTYMSTHLTTLVVVETTLLALGLLNALTHMHTCQNTTVFVVVHVNTRDNSPFCLCTGTCTYK